MRRPCWCIKQWQNVSQFLRNNRIKVPKDFFRYCSVHQHGRRDVTWKRRIIVISRFCLQSNVSFKRRQHWRWCWWRWRWRMNFRLGCFPCFSYSMTGKLGGHAGPVMTVLLKETSKESLVFTGSRDHYVKVRPALLLSYCAAASMGSLSMKRFEPWRATGSELFFWLTCLRLYCYLSFH